MKKLSDFKSVMKRPQLFTDSTNTPPLFLETNLVDPARVIKVFSQDPYAYIRIFYFQFLKLCFESEGVDYDGKINKLIDLIEGKEK